MLYMYIHLEVHLSRPDHMYPVGSSMIRLKGPTKNITNLTIPTLLLLTPDISGATYLACVTNTGYIRSLGTLALSKKNYIGCID